MGVFSGSSVHAPFTSGFARYQWFIKIRAAAPHGFL
jgi:hypothetical protein